MKPEAYAKNWKTTAIGVALAVLIVIQNQENLDDWRAWLVPALIAGLGVLARDADKSSQDSGIR